MKQLSKLGQKALKAREQTYKAAPNVYRFLTSRGVSVAIADEAQEFITDEWMKFFDVHGRGINSAIESVLSKLEAFEGAIDAVKEDVLTSFEESLD